MRIKIWIETKIKMVCSPHSSCIRVERIFNFSPEPDFRPVVVWAYWEQTTHHRDFENNATELNRFHINDYCRANYGCSKTKNGHKMFSDDAHLVAKVRKIRCYYA